MSVRTCNCSTFSWRLVEPLMCESGLSIVLLISSNPIPLVVRVVSIRTSVLFLDMVYLLIVVIYKFGLFDSDCKYYCSKRNTEVVR